jgi:potassium efflux system protein
MAVLPNASTTESIPIGSRILVTATFILAALALHWGMRRAARRLPRLLARHLGGGPRRIAAWERLAAVALLPFEVGLWLAAAYLVSEQFALLRRIRALSYHVLDMGLTAPLFVLDGQAYSGLDLLELPVVLLAVWGAVRLIGRFLAGHLLGSLGVESGAREAVGLVFRYAVLFVAALVVLQAWGIDVRSLSVFAGVVGVGIGFGMQNIANNFVSGLVLNLERPVRPGDFLTIGDLAGTVTRVGTRCTEIRTLDEVTILVPNSHLLENQVVNWTHGDPVCRIHVPVGVAYGSDVRRVRAALLESAQEHPDVVGDPRPRVEFRGFGDSGLDFELLVWTRDPRHQFRLRSDLNYRIEANLRRHGIQIPFPQRDLHLRSPKVERLLDAWSRRHFTDEELMPAGPDQPPPEIDPSMGSFDPAEDLGPRAWSDDRIAAFVARMRGPDGVPIHDRKHVLRVHPRCFVGREAVDWMVRREGLTREEALLLGRVLTERGAFHHVLDEHDFEDEALFYRFRADDPTDEEG